MSAVFPGKDRKQGRFLKTINRGVNILLAVAAGCGWLLYENIRVWWLPAVLLLLFVGVHLFPSVYNCRLPGKRLRVCADGAELLIAFLGSSLLCLVVFIAAGVQMLPAEWVDWIWAAVWCILAEALLFWDGILRVYGTSVQLGIRKRVIGILCGWIPIANLWALGMILRTVLEETGFEYYVYQRDEARKGQKLCATRYPLVLVHGVFFRDFRTVNYWGRIPKALERNGARIFYGNHQSALSIEESGKELAARIRQIVQEEGCEKVNLIAHSKGGLDCRWAITHEGAAPMVASLTTINTPHRGCVFAEYLLEKLPKAMQKKIAAGYERGMRLLGDTTPDFMASVTDLTASACKKLNECTPDAEGVYYQSVGSRLNRARGGKFPLNFSYHLVKYFDGENDGLVSADSFPWGENYTFLTVKGDRGISHGDMVDLNRENLPEFDVREFYVQLVSGLREKGY